MSVNRLSVSRRPSYSSCNTIILSILSSNNVIQEEFTSNCSIETVYTIIKNKIDNNLSANDFFLPSYGIWMNPKRTLDTYFLKENDTIEPKKKHKKDLTFINIILPSGDKELIECCDRTTVQGILVSLDDKPSTFSLETSACFKMGNSKSTNSNSKWLEPYIPFTMLNLISGDVLIYGERHERNMLEPNSNVQLRNTSNSPNSNRINNLKRNSYRKSVDSLTEKRKKRSRRERTTVKPNTNIKKKSPALPKNLLQAINSTNKALDSEELPITIDIALKIRIIDGEKRHTIKLSVPNTTLLIDVAQMIPKHLSDKTDTKDFSDFGFYFVKQQTKLNMNLLVTNLADTSLTFKLPKISKPLKDSATKPPKIFRSFRPKSSSKDVSESLSIIENNTCNEFCIEKINYRIVRKFIHWLIQEQVLLEEGIFRISANGSNVNEILLGIVNDPTYSIISKKYSPHDIAGAFKQYFRKSKIPAFPYNIYNDMIQCYKDGNVILDNLNNVMLKLPSENRNILGCIFAYLYTVQIQEETNFMSASNLGIVFGPTLLRDPSDIVDVGTMSFCSPIVSEIILNYKDLFNESEINIDDLSDTEFTEEDTETSDTLNDKDVSKLLYSTTVKSNNYYENTINDIIMLTSSNNSTQIAAGIFALKAALSDPKCIEFMIQYTSKEELIKLLIASTK